MRYSIFILSLITMSIVNGQLYQIEWQQCLGGSFSEKADDIIQSGNSYLVLGNTASNDGDVSFNHGGSDVWMVNLNSSGSIMWEKTFGGSQSEGVKRIIRSIDGNYFLLCNSDSSDGDISNDPYPDNDDYWIVKIDSSGNIIWDRIVGGADYEYLYNGIATEDGGVIALGHIGSQEGDISVFYGMNDIWMIKLNSEGDIEWDFTIGNVFFDFGFAIIQTSDGGYLVGGFSVIQGGGNLTCEPHSSLPEAVVIKLDADRNIEWQHCYGGSQDDLVSGFLEISDGFVILAGTYSNDGDVTGFHGLPGESSDIWVIKTDLGGNIIWQRCLGGSNDENAYDIIEKENGNFLIYGVTSSWDGDVSGNHSGSEYYSDIWLVELNPDGEIIYQQCIGGIEDEGVENGMIRKSDDNYIIAGKMRYSPSYDVQCTPHGEYFVYYDYWVFEIKDTISEINTNSLIEKELNVYPNPADEYMVFEYYSQINPNNVTKCETIIISDEFGQRVAELPVKTNKTVFDSRHLPVGIYFYQFQTNEKTYSGKFLKIN